MAAVMFGLLSAGCATMNKDMKVKCPKCGAVFTVDEGQKALQAGP
jgi:predicted Zn finger-like uncharacterized protein